MRLVDETAGSGGDLLPSMFRKLEVEQTPADVIAGRDPQLEKAIGIVLEQLERSPGQRPKRPPLPVR